MAGSGSASAMISICEEAGRGAPKGWPRTTATSSGSWRGRRATEAVKPRKATTAKVPERWARRTSEPMITATATMSQRPPERRKESSFSPRRSLDPARATRPDGKGTEPRSA